MTPLSIALGAKAWHTGLAAEKNLPLNFVEVSPIHRAFAPMAREQKFDISEMAIVTALQALAYSKPVLVLPVTIAARFQQHCLITRKSAPVRLADLAGRRIGVRAYTQTTGVWIRGILQNDYGVPAEAITWVTQEGAHLAEYRDPPWVEKVAPERTLVDLLRAGDVDAVILGNDLPDDPDFVPVIPEPRAAARTWYDKHKVVPINHVMVVRKDIAQAQPAAIRELWQAIHRAKPTTADVPDMAAIGIEANRRSLETILNYCEQQKLLPRRMTVDEIFAETLVVLGSALKN